MMEQMETIQAEFQRVVSRAVHLEREGTTRFRVFTPFQLEDGDHLAIVLKRADDHWVLSDEGHTFMHLTYDLEEQDLRRGTRQRIINNALTAFGVEDRDGELKAPILDERYGDTLFSFVQALLRVSDVTYLSRERARSTFLEDFRAFMSETVPEPHRTFDWHDPVHDPEGKYRVDCRVNHAPRPLMVFALPSDDRVRDATITLLQFERWGMPHRSLGVFQDQEEANRKVLARFTDVCDKQFSSLAANREKIAAFLREQVS